jgi:hypothetical protein
LSGCGVTTVERIKRGHGEGDVGGDRIRLASEHRYATVSRDGLPPAPEDLPPLGGTVRSDERLGDGGTRHSVERDAVRHDHLLHVLEVHALDGAKVRRVEGRLNF